MTHDSLLSHYRTLYRSLARSSTRQKDLVRRMRAVVEHLSDEAVEPDSPDYPGLAGLAAVLVEDRYLKHKDKEVRLHTVLACVEIFYMVSVIVTSEEQHHPPFELETIPYPGPTRSHASCT